MGHAPHSKEHRLGYTFFNVSGNSGIAVGNSYPFVAFVVGFCCFSYFDCVGKMQTALVTSTVLGKLQTCDAFPMRVMYQLDDLQSVLVM